MVGVGGWLVLWCPRLGWGSWSAPPQHSYEGLGTAALRRMAASTGYGREHWIRISHKTLISGINGCVTAAEKSVTVAAGGGPSDRRARRTGREWRYRSVCTGRYQ